MNPGWMIKPMKAKCLPVPLIQQAVKLQNQLDEDPGDPSPELVGTIVAFFKEAGEAFGKRWIMFQAHCEVAREHWEQQWQQRMN